LQSFSGESRRRCYADRSAISAGNQATQPLPTTAPKKPAAQEVGTGPTGIESVVAWALFPRRSSVLLSYVAILWLAYKEAKAMIQFDAPPPPKAENKELKPARDGTRGACPALRVKKEPDGC
jgi:hypothetical protein